jgi:hypothetical protein
MARYTTNVKEIYPIMRRILACSDRSAEGAADRPAAVPATDEGMG